MGNDQSSPSSSDMTNSYTSNFNHEHQTMSSVQSSPLSTTFGSGRNEIETGRLKRFLNERGYGFIEPDNESSDVFVHCSDIPSYNQLERKRLLEWQPVEYKVVVAPDGRHKGKNVTEPNGYPLITC